MPDSASVARLNMTQRIVLCLALAILVAVGGWLRLRNLGRLGLVADEGYHALAVRGILKYGVPKLESGDVYARSIPFLYMEAMLAKALGLNEYSLRLPAVLFGMATIVLVYCLGSSVFGWRVGLLAAALMAVSVWEVELSRYGRAYTALQAMYVLALWLFHRGYLKKQEGLAEKVGFFFAALVAVLFHEVGALLATCFLIPPLLGFSIFKRKWIYLAGPLVIACLWAGAMELPKALERINEPVVLGTRNNSKPDVSIAAPVSVAVEEVHLRVQKEPSTQAAQPQATDRIKWGRLLQRGLTRIGKRLQLPDGRLVAQQMMQGSSTFILLTVLVISASLLLGYRGFKQGELGQRLLAVAMIGAAWTHQFGVVVLLWVAYLCAFVRRKEDFTRQPLSIVYVVGGICLVYWLYVIWWFGGAARPERLFDYPHFYRAFLSWLLKGWPALTVVFAGGVALLARHALHDPHSVEPRFILGAIFVPVVVTSFVGFGRYAARYIFHLYPLILIVVAYAVVYCSQRRRASSTPRSLVRRRIAIACIAAALSVIGYDTDPVRAWAVGERTYRTFRDPIRGPINEMAYASFHQDQLTPGEYVRGRRKAHDRVLALGPYYQVAIYRYYAGRIDYTLAEHPKPRQVKIRRKGDRVDRVTGHPMLNNLEDLQELLASERDYAIWVLGDRNMLLPDNRYYSKPVKEYLATLAKRVEYIGLDGKTFALRIR